MTIEQNKLQREGRELWFEYVRVNGYSFTFNNEGIKRLSKLLDLKLNYIRQRLSIYLENQYQKQVSSGNNLILIINKEGV